MFPYHRLNHACYRLSDDLGVFIFQLCHRSGLFPFKYREMFIQPPRHGGFEVRDHLLMHDRQSLGKERLGSLFDVPIMIDVFLCRGPRSRALMAPDSGIYQIGWTLTS